MIYYKLKGTTDEPGGDLVSTHKIQALQESEQMIWAEIMKNHRVILACSPRKCAIIQFAEKYGQLLISGERVLNLGEKASSFSFNFRFAFIQVLDSSKNSMAFYTIEELVWPKDDLRIS